MTRSIAAGSLLAFVILCPGTKALAGPPFNTDDPEPVDLMHWEFYLASMQHFERSTADATLPHIEVNFGALRDVQLHVIAPMGFVRTDAGSQYGYGDTELGVKYRFVQESDKLPQIGTFPIVEIPTGNSDRGLGSGDVQVLVPLWIQKSWGALTTYGGGGFWYNPVPQGRNWGFFGWEAQYDFTNVVTLGGEIYYHTPDTRGADSDAGFNVGGFLNLDEHNHILYSIGHSLHGEQTTTGYLGYQVTI